MEASAVHAPAGLGRLSLGGPLLRLRSDEQLVALFREGSEDAFAAIHERYRQRLFAYVRQMLSGASRQDAEDVMQDVFMRAYSALRKDRRELNLKAWLYRVAHNRCVDHVRRPVPAAADVFEMSRSPLVDPMETAQRRDDLRRLVADVGRLPDQQRSALLLREIDGLAYSDIAEVLGVTVPAVKSLLVRARIGLAEAAEARETDCAVIRHDLAAAYERGVKAPARARRHMRECSACSEFKVSLRSVRRQFAALSPAGLAGPLALAAKLLGAGGAGGGAAATASSGAVVAGTATACKVAAVVCTAAIATGGAVEVGKRVGDRAAPATAAKEPGPAGSVAPAAVAPSVGAAAVRPEVILRRTDRSAPAAAPRAERRREAAAKQPDRAVAETPAAKPVPATPADSAIVEATGGAIAPSAAAPSSPTTTPGPILPAADKAPSGAGGNQAPAEPGSGSQGGASAGSASGGESGDAAPSGGSAPPGHH